MTPFRLETMRGRLTAALLAMLFVCAFAAGPAPAFGLFNEPADSYPAAQDLEGGGKTIGEVIYPADIPEGQIYRVYARTTSRMCIMYESAVDCDQQVNKEQALIMRQGDTIYVEFFMSKAYTYLYYPGTAEEAAALAEGDGTVPSAAYLAGDPATGYVPHRFSISIPALNYPLTMATFSGGNADRSQWYTRQAVFIPTPDTLAAIEAAKNPTTYTVTFDDGFGGTLATQTVEAGSSATAPADPAHEGYTFAGWDRAFDRIESDLVVTATWTVVEPSDDNSEQTDNEDNPSSDDQSENGDDSNGQNEEQQSSQDESSTADNASRNTAVEEEEEQEQAPTAAAAPAPASAGGSDAAAAGGQTGSSSSSSSSSQGEGSDEGDDSEENDDGSGEDDAGSGGGQESQPLKGVRMTMAGFEIPEEDDGTEQVVLELEEVGGLSPLQILSLCLTLAMSAGAVWRALGFARGLK